MCCTSAVNAHNAVFIDALYWHATEAFDWAYANDEHLPDQSITYKTVAFHYHPSFRIGARSETQYDLELNYTQFYTRSTDAMFGNMISGFLGDRIANFPDGYFFQSGQIEHIIRYNMVDFEIGKPLLLGDRLQHMPMVGIRGGRIYQTAQGNFQGPVSATETIKNNFTGIGPKVALDTQITLYHLSKINIHLIANFAANYLWGHWKITDIYTDSIPGTVSIITPSRNVGAFATQAALGINLQYHNVLLTLSYEIMDWFNQCQFFDNGTGAHSNNLVLQGYTLRMSYDL